MTQPANNPGAGWGRTYKPQTVMALPLEPGLREQLSAFVANRYLPDLLLSGSGPDYRQLIADTVTSELPCDVLRAHGSRKRESEVLREVERFFNARSLTQRPFRVAIIQHSGVLSADAQLHLGHLIRHKPPGRRVILLADSTGRLDHTVTSQCQRVELLPPPADELARVLTTVASEMGIPVPPAAARAYGEAYDDLVQMLGAAELEYRTSGELTGPVRLRGQTRELSEFDGTATREEALIWDLPLWTAAGRATLLSAPPKLGKSTFAAYYSKAKAAGASFLGHSLTQGPVLWVGPDEANEDVVNRFRSLGAEAGVHIWTGPTPTIEEIALRARRLGAGLVVVDTLPRVAGVADENDNAGWIRWSERALPLIRRSGAAWLFIHHQRKGGGGRGEAIRGASAIFGWVDIAFSLSPVGRHVNRRRLVVDGTRYERPDDLVIELRDGEYRISSQHFAFVSDDSLPNRAGSVLETLTDEPATLAVIQARLAAAQQEIPESTLYDYLVDLVARGLAIRAGGRKGDPARWRRNVSSDSSRTPGVSDQTRGKVE